MTKNARVFQKRAKEKARKQKQQDKAARRLAAKERKVKVDPQAEGAPDPDIAGISLGPQPLPALWDAEPETV